MKDGTYKITKKGIWHGILKVKEGITFFPGVPQADFSFKGAETAKAIILSRGLTITPLGE